MKCVISGSFRKFYKDIVGIIQELENRNVQVLAPKVSQVKNPGEEFVILESDFSTSIKDLEQNHLELIKQSDFLYIYNPNGYVGTSTAMEIGWALALGKPIYALEQPTDATLAQFTTVREVNSF